MSQVTAGKLSEFKPIKRNSNKHTVRGLAALDHSIEQDGYVAPMTAAADGAVLDGNARLERSFEKLGDEAIVIHHDGTKPIVMVRDDIPNEDDPRAKSIHYRANTVQWLDFALDSAVVMADIEAGFNFESIDVTLPDLGKLLERDVAELLRGEAGKDTEPQLSKADELQKVWQVKPGDLWQCGEHRVICGDCTDRAVVERVMGGERAVLYSTDPPYGVAYGVETGSDDIKFDAIINDENDGEKLQKFLESAFSLHKEYLVNNAAWYLWHAQMTQGFFAAATAAAAVIIHRQIIWVKPSLIMGHGDYHWKHELCFYGWVKGNRPNWYGDRKQTTVWEIGRENDGVHPTQKPVDIFERPMRFNTKAGDICFDPFLGSGTTLIACQNLNRRCRGIELHPPYVSVTLQRFLDHTGIQPILLTE